VAAEAFQSVRPIGPIGQIDTVVESVVVRSVPAGSVEPDWDRSSSLSSPVPCCEDTLPPGSPGLRGHHPLGARQPIGPRRHFFPGTHYEVWGQRDERYPPLHLAATRLSATLVRDSTRRTADIRHSLTVNHHTQTGQSPSLQSLHKPGTQLRIVPRVAEDDTGSAIPGQGQRILFLLVDGASQDRRRQPTK
jgi:hypothetical protein